MIKKIYNKFKLILKKNEFNKIKTFVNSNTKYKKTRLIVCWEFGGFPAILAKNAMLSKALNVRGYKTHFIICDGTPQACIQRGIEQNEKFDEWGKKCSVCLSSMKAVAKKYFIDYSLASEYIDDDIKLTLQNISETININDILNYNYLDINVGDLAWTSLNRYMKGYVVEIKDLKPEDEKIYRKYLFAALVNTFIANNVLQKLKPHSIYTSHGVYVDYAPPAFVARNNGIKSLIWDSGFADFLHYFTTPNNSKEYQVRAISEKDWNLRKCTPLLKEEEQSLNDYFYQRYFEAKASDLQIKTKPEDKDLLKNKLNIKNNNPIICLFTHINWDAAFGTGVMIFENPNVWVIESIKKMQEIKNVNWIIRVHPGETFDGSLYTTNDLIKEKFPILPEHIKILYNNSDINTYGIYQLIDTGITIYGTVGVELSVFGKPMIVAGKAHFGGKGFSIDATDKNNYFSILENAAAIKPLNPDQIDLAKKYAYSYFIQRQIPLNIINKAQGHWGDIDLDRLDDLLPGRDVTLDKICDGIINGTDVFLD